MSTNERPPQLDAMQQAIVYAVDRAMASYRLKIDRHDDEIQQLKNTVYGNSALKIRGLVDLFDDINKKLEQLLDQRRDLRAMLQITLPVLAFAMPVVSALVAEGLKRWLFP